MSSETAAGCTQSGAVWIAPTMDVVPIGATASNSDARTQRGLQQPPPSPAEPSSKLGFAFEMSFPMSARTTD